MRRLVLIDGNPLLYRSFYSKGTSHLKTSRGALSGAFYGALRTFQAIQKRFPNSDFLFAFDRGLSGRDKIYPGYKPLSGQYESSAKPEGFTKQLLHVQEFLRAMAIPVFAVNGIEADDLISVASYGWVEQFPSRFSAVIVSSDRDFLQLVSPNVLLYDDRSKVFFGPDEVQTQFGVPVDKFVWYKALIGDSSDCIPSVPGYGPVRAKRAVLQGSMPTYKVLSAILRRNYDLIRLPKNSYEIFSLSSEGQQSLELAIADMFRYFLSTSYKGLQKYLDFDRAQELLNEYECKSLCLESFSKYSTTPLLKYRTRGC
jgi:5'-3' exonuclease